MLSVFRGGSCEKKKDSPHRIGFDGDRRRGQAWCRPNAYPHADTDADTDTDAGTPKTPEADADTSVTAGRAASDRCATGFLPIILEPAGAGSPPPPRTADSHRSLVRDNTLRPKPGAATVWQALGDAATKVRVTLRGARRFDACSTFVRRW
jgi:hypothetical protein